MRTGLAIGGPPWGPAGTRRAREGLGDRHPLDGRRALHHYNYGSVVKGDNKGTEAIVVDGMRALYSAWGAEVVAGTTGDALLDAMGETGRCPDLIVADYRLAHGELGMRLLQRVQADVAETAKVEQHPRMEGRQMLMVLAPK